MMKMFFLVTILSLGCSFFQKKEITIIGVAYDAKPSAIVVADDKGMYYLDELASWDKKYYGKKVKVTGELVIENHPDTGDHRVIKQEIIGTIKIIKKAKWTLLE